MTPPADFRMAAIGRREPLPPTIAPLADAITCTAMVIPVHYAAVYEVHTTKRHGVPKGRLRSSRAPSTVALRNTIHLGSPAAEQAVGPRLREAFNRTQQHLGPVSCVPFAPLAHIIYRIK